MILHFVNSYNFYRSHFHHISKSLVNDGYNIVVINPDFEGIYDGVSYKKVFLVRSGLNFFSFIFSFIQFLYLFLKFKPIKVHSFTIKPFIITTLINIFIPFNNVKFFHTITGMGSIFTNDNSIKRYFFSKFFYFIYKILCLKSNNNFILENPDDYSFFKKHFVNSKHNLICVFGAGVKDSYFKSIDRDFYKPNLNIVFIGRLLKDKGVIEFLDSAVQCSHLPFQFSLYGDFDTANPSALSEDCLFKYRSYKNITLHGFVENSKLLQLYNEFDIICLPSYREGCPKVLLEASARGTPIITTNVVGCKHLIPSSDFGFLVEPFSVSDLVSKLEFIHNNRASLVDISRNIFKFASSNYTESVIYDNYKKFYCI